MSWLRLDDQGAFHAKVVRAGNEGYGAWTRAGQWCSGHDRTGFIPFEVAHLIAPARVWAKVLKAGLLDQTDLDGYQIHDFTDWNPTEAELDEHREHIHRVRSEAGRRGGLKSASKRHSNSVHAAQPIAQANGQANQPSNGEQVAVQQNEQIQAPSHPIPSQPKEEGSPDGFDRQRLRHDGSQHLRALKECLVAIARRTGFPNYTLDEGGNARAPDNAELITVCLGAPAGIATFELLKGWLEVEFERWLSVWGGQQTFQPRLRSFREWLAGNRPGPRAARDVQTRPPNEERAYKIGDGS